MDRRCRIELLGWLRVEQGERIITRFMTYKTGVLLAYLAFYRHHSHPREQLIEMLWPECDPEAGRNSLSKALSSLRHQLEPPGVPAGAILLADRASVQLNPDATTTDVAEFEAALQAAARDGPGQGDHLAHAVDLYHGELLPGCYEDWSLRERARLIESYLQALNRLIAPLEQAGEWGRALDYARRAVNADPLREESHATLIRLYVASGEPAAARREYEEWERMLGKELGIAPDPTTRALIQQQAGNVPRTQARTTAAPVSTPSTPSAPLSSLSTGTATPSLPSAEPGPTGSLPMQFTRFFGRMEEIAHLVDLLSPVHPLTRSPVHLLSLTGPGGTGKTRLALETARQLLEPYQGAVWFVPLAEVSDPRRVVEVIAETMRLPRSHAAEPLQQVVEALSRQPSLLVLDNFEQLLRDEEPGTQKGVQSLRRLQEQAPSLCCLVTSRRRLDMEGEKEFSVPPLPAPHGIDTPEHLAQLASVQLFIDRAQAVRPDFQVTRGNAAAVAALCQRLEGFPLAIELAAARSQVLTPAQMLLQLEHRFDFLVSRQRDRALRHRTLRAAFDWSYQILTPPLQRLFARLSVFRGGWDLAAAEQVTGYRLQGTGEEDFPVTSHEVLDYLAQLREDSLVIAEEDYDAGEIRFRMLETLREYAQEKLAPEEGAALQRRHADFFLALAETADPALAGPDQAEWLSRLEMEHDNIRATLRWCEEQSEAEVGLRLCSALRRFWLVRGYWSEGRERLAIALAQGTGTVRPEIRANALDCAGMLAYRQGDHTTGRACFEECLALRRELKGRLGIAAALHNLGNVTHGQGDSAAARALYEESLALRRDLDDRPGIAPLLNNLGTISLEQGDYQAARRLFEESLALRREMGDKRGIAASLFNLVLVLWNQQDTSSARTLLEECLAIHRELKDKQGIASVLSRLGHILLHDGDFAAAYATLQESLVLRQELGDKTGIAGLLHGLGNAALGLGDTAAAHVHYKESLELSREAGDRQRLADALEGFAGLALAQQQPERAARLFGMEEAVRDSIGIAVNLFDRPYYNRNLAVARTALDEEAFAAAWAEGRAMTLEAAVTYALEKTDFPAAH